MAKRQLLDQSKSTLSDGQSLWNRSFVGLVPRPLKVVPPRWPRALALNVPWRIWRIVVVSRRALARSQIYLGTVGSPAQFGQRAGASAVVACRGEPLVSDREVGGDLSAAEQRLRAVVQFADQAADAPRSLVTAVSGGGRAPAPIRCRRQ